MNKLDYQKQTSEALAKALSESIKEARYYLYNRLEVNEKGMWNRMKYATLAPLEAMHAKIYVSGLITTEQSNEIEAQIEALRYLPYKTN